MQIAIAVLTIQHSVLETPVDGVGEVIKSATEKLLNALDKIRDKHLR